MTRWLDVTDDALELLDGDGGHDELVLAKPAEPYAAVPFPEQVQRVVELRQVLDLSAVMCRICRYQSSPIGSA